MKKRKFKLFRKFLKLFDTDELSIKAEAYRICLLFSTAILVGMIFAFLLGQASDVFSALHWSIRILFEDFGGLESLPKNLYSFAFVLKLAGHMIVPLIITLLTAKILSVHFFKPTGKNLSQHLIVYGRVPNSLSLVQQLSEGGVEDLVFIGQMESISGLPLDVRAVFLQRSSDISLDLTQANIESAKYLLVTSERGESPSQFESRAVMAMVTARSLSRKVYILLESPFDENPEFLKNLGANEVISLKDLLPSMVSLCLINDHFSPFLTEIITAGRGNTLSLEALPSFVEGLNFTDALLELKEKRNWLLLGIKRREKFYTNPWKLALEKDDQAFVLKEG